MRMVLLSVDGQRRCRHRWLPRSAQINARDCAGESGVVRRPCAHSHATVRAGADGGACGAGPRPCCDTHAGVCRRLLAPAADYATPRSQRGAMSSGGAEVRGPGIDLLVKAGAVLATSLDLTT